MLGAQQAAFEQDFLDRGGSRDRHQPRDFSREHGKTELADGRAETRGFAGDAQVAGTGDRQAATHARPVDERHGRVPAAGQRVEGATDRFVVGQRLVRRVARIAEFLEVAAGREGGAGAAHHHRAQRRVGVEFAHHDGEAAPHGGINGVEFARIRQRDDGDGAVVLALEKNVSRHDLVNGCD